MTHYNNLFPENGTKNKLNNLKNKSRQNSPAACTGHTLQLGGQHVAAAYTGRNWQHKLRVEHRPSPAMSHVIKPVNVSQRSKVKHLRKAYGRSSGLCVGKLDVDGELCAGYGVPDSA
jgi:hypothetical protein